MQSRTCSNYAEPKPSLAMHFKMHGKGTKKICDFQIFAQKVCDLTLHFAQILLYTNKVSDCPQKREGDGREKQISLPCLLPFIERPSERKREEGRDIFEFIEKSPSLHQGRASASSKTRTPLIEYSCPVRLMITLSPSASDSQYVTSELAVRHDGLYPILNP